jgi:hypothetical protein
MSECRLALHKNNINTLATSQITLFSGTESAVLQRKIMAARTFLESGHEKNTEITKIFA